MHPAQTFRKAQLKRGNVGGETVSRTRHSPICGWCQPAIRRPHNEDHCLAMLWKEQCAVNVLRTIVFECLWLRTSKKLRRSCRAKGRRESCHSSRERRAEFLHDVWAFYPFANVWRMRAKNASRKIGELTPQAPRIPKLRRRRGSFTQRSEESGTRAKWAVGAPNQAARSSSLADADGSRSIASCRIWPDSLTSSNFTDTRFDTPDSCMVTP